MLGSSCKRIPNHGAPDPGLTRRSCVTLSKQWRGPRVGMGTQLGPWDGSRGTGPHVDSAGAAGLPPRTSREEVQGQVPAGRAGQENLPCPPPRPPPCPSLFPPPLLPLPPFLPPFPPPLLPPYPSLFPPPPRHLVLGLGRDLQHAGLPAPAARAEPGAYLGGWRGLLSWAPPAAP